MHYQLFSERCSGSNFVEAFLSENFPNLVNCRKYGFKHWLTKKFFEEENFPPKMLFILVNRNPFDWLRSIHRQPWHCEHSLRGKCFSSFIRSEWQCVWDEQARITDEDPRWMKEMKFERNPLNNLARFTNVLEVRRIKYGLWSDRVSKHPKTIKIRHEDMLKSPATVLTEVARIVDLPEPSNFTPPEGYKGNLSWKRKLALTLSVGLIGGYKQRGKLPISFEDLDFIVENLDPEQEKSWGYHIEKLLEQEKTRTREYLRSKNQSQLPSFSSGHSIPSVESRRT